MKIEMSNSTLNTATNDAAPDLQEAVKCRLYGRVQNLLLVVESEGIVLRGKARSFHAKQLAQHLLMEMTSVRILANDIEVVTGEEP